jgi:hypothetical protein
MGSRGLTICQSSTLQASGCLHDRLDKISTHHPTLKLLRVKNKIDPAEDRCLTPTMPKFRVPD